MKYLIALIGLLLPTYLIRFNLFGRVPTTLLEIIIYVVFFYGLVTLGYTHMLKLRRRVWLPIGVLLLAVLISLYISPDKLAALGQAKAIFVDPLLVFWLILVYLEPKDLRWTIYGLSLSSLSVSGYTILQKILGNVTADGRVIGIFGYSPNYVAMFLTPIMVIAATYGFLMIKKNKVIAIAMGLIFVINVVALYLSDSRSGELAVVGGLVAFLIFNYWSVIKRKLSYKIGLAALIILVIAGAWFVFRPNFNHPSARMAASNNIRWQIWSASWELGRAHPVLGVGLGNFQESFTSLTQDRGNFKEFIIPVALTPHNIFLMFWLSLGLLGIIAFIWLSVVFFCTGSKTLKSDWSKILMAAMIALLLQGLVDTPYFKNDLSVLFWLIFAMMILLD